MTQEILDFWPVDMVLVNEPSSALRAELVMLTMGPNAAALRRVREHLGDVAISFAPAQHVVALDCSSGRVRFRPPSEAAEVWWDRWMEAIPELLGVPQEEDEPSNVAGSADEVIAEVELLDAVRGDIGADMTVEFDAEDGNWPVNVRIGRAEFRADNKWALSILRCVAAYAKASRTS